MKNLILKIINFLINLFKKKVKHELAKVKPEIEKPPFIRYHKKKSPEWKKKNKNKSKKY